MPSVSWKSLMDRSRWIEVARIAAVSAVIALYQAQLVPLAVLLAAVAIGVYPLARKGLVDLVRERKIGTEVFITIATAIAMAGREYVAGAMVMTIILIAEFIAELNGERARASIRNLIGSVPQHALVRRGGAEERVAVADLRPGDVVIVRAGEQVPADGIVRAGQGAVDEAPITGESVPRDKVAGAQVFAGTVLSDGALDVETQRTGTDTMFARIVAMVETADQRQAPIQRLADRVAAWLIPVVLVFLLGTYLWTRDLRLIITLLIFTSPAELGLATPLVIIASVARAARAGILLKGGLHLEQLARVDTIAFDKTGTLTVGRPEVAGVEVLGDVPEDELLRVAAGAERRSSHPLAKAIVDHARARDLDVPEPTDFEVVPGRGVRAVIEGKVVLAGNAAYLAENAIAVPPAVIGPIEAAVLHLGPDILVFLNSVRLTRARLSPAE